MFLPLLEEIDLRVGVQRELLQSGPCHTRSQTLQKFDLGFGLVRQHPRFCKLHLRLWLRRIIISAAKDELNFLKPTHFAKSYEPITFLHLVGVHPPNRSEVNIEELQIRALSEHAAGLLGFKTILSCRPTAPSPLHTQVGHISPTSGANVLQELLKALAVLQLERVALVEDVKCLETDVLADE